MNITTLVPWRSTTDGDYYVLNQIYHKLVEMDFYSVFRPSFAREWSCADDGKTWTFKLLDGIYWHTGNNLFGEEKVQVTAEDVKFTLEFHMDPDNGSTRYADLVATIDTITVIDPLTIEIKTYDIDVLFEYKMYQILIIPSKAVETGWDFNAHPVGSNAFKFSNHVIDTEVVLVRNDDYYLRPELDKVIFKIIPDTSVLAIALENKEIDVATSVTAEHLDNLAVVPHVILRPSGTGTSRWLGMNPRHEFFQDRDVRRALAMMLDIDAACGAIFQSSTGIKLYERAYAPIPPERLAGNQSARYKAQFPEYNPEEGMSILESKGWALNSDGIFEKDGKTFSFVLQVGAGNSIVENYAVIVSTMFKASGIDCTPYTAEWGTHLSDMAAGTLLMWSVGGYSSLDGPMQIMHSNPNSYTPNPGYSNPDVDALLEEAWRTIDTEKRGELIAQAAELYVYDMVFITSFFQYSQIGIGKNVLDFDHPSVYITLVNSWRNVSVE